MTKHGGFFFFFFFSFFLFYFDFPKSLTRCVAIATTATTTNTRRAAAVSAENGFSCWRRCRRESVWDTSFGRGAEVGHPHPPCATSPDDDDDTPSSLTVAVCASFWSYDWWLLLGGGVWSALSTPTHLQWVVYRLQKKEIPNSDKIRISPVGGPTMMHGLPSAQRDFWEEKSQPPTLCVA